MTTDKLDLFLQKVAGIGASTFNLFGTNLPGMGGSAAGGFGTGANSDVTDKLARNAIAFATAYRNPSVGRETLQRLSDIVEGQLMAEHALSNLNDKELEALVDELHDLLDQRA